MTSILDKEEETYKVTIHLTDGTIHKVHGEVPASTLMDCYRCLGADESRVKYPVAPGKMQLLPASSILYVEAEGNFD